MSGGPTIIVKFGASVAADQVLFVVELDNTLNIDSAGEVKTQFFPGDEIFFLMHYDPAKLTVQAIKTTAGQVVLHGQVIRSNTLEELFTAPDEPILLPHMPSGEISVQWFGRTSSLVRSGRSVTAADTPCLGNITYPYTATLAKLIPPPLSLAADEEFPIAVVIYVEAAA